MRYLSHLWASLCLFGRLPLYRIWTAPSDAYRYATHYWPIAGAFYAFIAGAVAIYALYPLLPAGVASALLLILSALLSGAFHEDGLADFLDGFGGGQTRERILQIMKDSHIGTYGVLGLVMYYLATYSSIMAWIPAFRPRSAHLCLLLYVLVAFWARCAASLVPSLLSYARKSDDAKVGFSYAPWKKRNFALLLAEAVVFVFSLHVVAGLEALETAIWTALPLVSTLFLMRMMKRSIGGYTGDCCGAAVLLAELVQNMFIAYLASAI